MRKIIQSLFLLVFFVSCSETQKSPANATADSATVRKKTFAEELPPPSDFRQFK
jgi:hypothetical protein